MSCKGRKRTAQSKSHIVWGQPELSGKNNDNNNNKNPMWHGFKLQVCNDCDCSNIIHVCLCGHIKDCGKRFWAVSTCQRCTFPLVSSQCH